MRERHLWPFSKRRWEQRGSQFHRVELSWVFRKQTRAGRGMYVGPKGAAIGQVSEVGHACAAGSGDREGRGSGVQWAAS